MLGNRIALLVGSSLVLSGCGRVAYELVSPLLASDGGEVPDAAESAPSNSATEAGSDAPSAPNTDVTPLTGVIIGLDAGATFPSTPPSTSPTVSMDVDASLTETRSTDISTNSSGSPTSPSSDSANTDSSNGASSGSTSNTDMLTDSNDGASTSAVTSGSNGGTDNTATTSSDANTTTDTSASSDIDSSSGCTPGLFTAPVAVSGLPAPAFSPSLSADGLTLYFASSGDIFTATRSDNDSLVFGGVAELAAVNTGDTNELTPMLSRDGLRIYFTRGDDPFRDLYVASRATTTGTFDAPNPLGGLNTPGFTEVLPRESANGLDLFFSTLRGPTVFDVYTSHRNTLGDAYGSPAAVTELNTNSDDSPGGSSSDGLTLMMASKRPGSLGAQDVWTATRPTTGSSFTSVINEADVNSTFNDLDPTLSADDRELFFASDRTGQTLIYRALRCP